MRVLHVILTMDPAGGGPPVVAACLAAAMAGLGHRTSIVACTTDAGAEPIHAMLHGIPHGDAVTLHLLDRLTRLERHLGSRARRALPALVADADVIHCHGVWDAMLHHAGATALRSSRPLVVTPHGMLDPWSLAQGAMRKRLMLRVGGAGRMLRSAALLHTLNSDERRLLDPLALGVPGRTIPNGVFAEQIDPLPPLGLFRAAHPELGADPFVLFLGRLHMKKGLDILADAFAAAAPQMESLRLVVAGPDDGVGADFAARIGAAGLAARTHMVGPIYGASKFHALRDAACFCLPSRQEGFSMAITEAMGCGTPVVISDQCHFPEVAESGAGAVVELRADAVAAAIMGLLEDETARTEAGRLGRALVLERYTWPAIGAQMLDAYRAAGAPSN